MEGGRGVVVVDERGLRNIWCVYAMGSRGVVVIEECLGLFSISLSISLPNLNPIHNRNVQFKGCAGSQNNREPRMVVA